MDLSVKILLLIVLASSTNAELLTENFYEDTTDVDTTIETFTTTTESKSISNIDILQYQLNQILVQFCASEIDRNKTASAILKFGQLVDAKASMRNVVEFYIENYAESFDNLLLFIDQTSSLDVQNVAYNTLVEATKLNRINVINLLSFERFIRIKFEGTDADDEERKIFGDLLFAVGNETNELIVATDLNRLITVIKGSDNPSRIFELIPRIVQGIDLTNFKDMDRIFNFSMQLPQTIQLKLINEVLSEMGRKIQYQHLFHVILQTKSLGNSSRKSAADKCLLSSIENEIPPRFQKLLVDGSLWQIYSLSDSYRGFLTSKNSEKYSKTLLFLNSDQQQFGWEFRSSRSLNSVSVSIFSADHHNNHYISVDYCFDNDSFPVVKRIDSSDDTQDKWYLLMSSDHTYLQLKNIYTNELLVVDDIKEMVNDGVERSRLAFSTSCLDCDASKFSIVKITSSFGPIFARPKCEHDIWKK